MSVATKAPHECPHTNFQYERVAQKGYWLRCYDCDTAVWGSNTLKAALKDFDRQIRKAKAAAKKSQN